MCLSGKVDLSRTLRFKATPGHIFILVLVINVEVIKTAASFLIICQDNYLHNGSYFCSENT